MWAQTFFLAFMPPAFSIIGHTLTNLHIHIRGTSAQPTQNRTDRNTDTQRREDTLFIKNASLIWPASFPKGNVFQSVVWTT